MREIAHGRLVVVTDTEVIQEILHRYGAIGRFAEAVAMAQDVIKLVSNVIPVTVADMQATVRLFLGVPSRDVVHAAVMQNRALTHIVTPDTHFDLIHGVQRLDAIVLYHGTLKLAP
jgi:hypothetical protein